MDWLLFEGHMMYLEDNYGDGYDHGGGRSSGSSGSGSNDGSSSNGYAAATRAASAKLTQIFGVDVKEEDVMKRVHFSIKHS